MAHQPHHFLGRLGNSGGGTFGVGSISGGGTLGVGSTSGTGRLVRGGSSGVGAGGNSGGITTF